MRSSFWTLIVCCLLTGCDFRKSAPPPQSGAEEITLTVFAAASLTNAFTEIEQAFEANHPNVDVVLHFAGSQQLAQQINHGAPADVFASANLIQMHVAINSGRIDEQKLELFAHNRLSAVIPPGNPAAIASIEDLARPGLLIVLADELVPIGHYSKVFLHNASQTISASFEGDVLANVASYEQNVQAVLTKVSLGEADAGIVYTSDLYGTNAVRSVDIPAPLNPTTDYLIAALSDTGAPEAAQAFTAFVNTQEGQRILAKHGFISENPA